MCTINVKLGSNILPSAHACIYLKTDEMFPKIREFHVELAITVTIKRKNLLVHPDPKHIF